MSANSPRDMMNMPMHASSGSLNILLSGTSRKIIYIAETKIYITMFFCQTLCMYSMHKHKGTANHSFLLKHNIWPEKESNGMSINIFCHKKYIYDQQEVRIWMKHYKMEECFVITVSIGPITDTSLIIIMFLDFNLKYGCSWVLGDKQWTNPIEIVILLFAELLVKAQT